MTGELNKYFKNHGAGGGNRTPDRLITNQIHSIPQPTETNKNGALERWLMRPVWSVCEKTTAKITAIFCASQALPGGTR